MTEPRQGRPFHFVAWLVAERLLRGCVTVVALAAVARHLTPAGFGVLNYANAVVSLAIPLAQLGLDSVLVRDLVRYPPRNGVLLGTSFALRLAAGCLCAIALVWASRISDTIGAARPALGPISIIAVVQAGEVVDCWFRSRVNSRAVVIIRGSVIVLGSVVKLLLVAAGAGLVAFAWVYTAEATVFVVILIAYARNAANPMPRWRFEMAAARSLLAEGSGFALAGFLGSIALRADQIAVAGTLDGKAAGLYYGALRLMEIPVLVATATATSLFPALATDTDRPGTQSRLVSLFGVVSCIAWLTAIGMSLAAPWILPLILGEAYRGAWPVLVIHGWASLFLFSGFIRANFLAVSRAPTTQIATSALALMMQLMLNYMLVSRFGIYGAAAAFLGTQVFNAWAVPLLLPPLRPCITPQAVGLLAFWRPSAWKELVAVVSK